MRCVFVGFLCWNLCKNHIFYKVKLYELLFARNISFSITISIEWSILGLIVHPLYCFFGLWCIRNWTFQIFVQFSKLLTDFLMSGICYKFYFLVPVRSSCLVSDLMFLLYVIEIYYIAGFNSNHLAFLKYFYYV